jgi:hypothetical protein
MKLIALPRNWLSGLAHYRFHFPYLLSLPTIALMLSLCCPTQAQAQQSYVTIQKGQLQHAGWHTAPLQIQILDERPRVSDLRTPEQAPENFVIPISPMPTVQGQTTSVGSGVRMVHSNLPQAGFGQTNIPAAGLGPARSLPSTRSGGLSPIDKAPRPIGLTAPKGSERQLSVSAKTPVAAATYSQNYNHGLSLLSGSSGADKSVREIVRADLIRH